MIPGFTCHSKDDFPLHHPEVCTSNIFVDNDFNINCIIDWAFSISVPVAELLTTPDLAFPKAPPEPPLIVAFRTGFMAQAEKDGVKICSSV